MHHGRSYYHHRVLPIVPRAALTVAPLLALFATLAVTSMRLECATSDEITHLPSGYTYLATGDFRLNPQHPPLVKLLAALPLLALDPALDLGDPAWVQGEEWAFGHRFLYTNDADRLLLWARLPTVALAMLAGLYVWLWASALWGRRAALLALLLYATCPTVLAHGRLVTMDTALSCFMLATVYHLWVYLRGGAGLHLLGCGAALGCALAAKFSGVFLVPALVLLVLVWVLRPFPDGRAADDQAARLRGAALVGVVVTAIAAVLTWACYGFPADPTVYLDGLLRVNADHDPDYRFFLLGRFREGGFWWYFAAAFLLKTRLAVVGLLLTAAVVAGAGKTRKGWTDELFLAVPPLVLLVVTSALAANIGVRYILPIYPMLLDSAARVAAPTTTGRFLPAFVLALTAWAVLATAAIHPHYISYFGELSGGPSRGHRCLDDSNIDWGQDLRALAEELEERGTERVFLRYAWPVSGSPEYYGIRYEPLTDELWDDPSPEPGFYALSTQELIRGELWAEQYGAATDWLSRHEPVGRIGYSIYLFEFVRSP